MRTDLTLILALAAKGNAFLRGAEGRMEVLAGHPSFSRFHDLAFVRQTGLGGDIVAEEAFRGSAACGTRGSVASGLLSPVCGSTREQTLPGVC